MTTQVSEEFEAEGQLRSLLSEPLSDLLARPKYKHLRCRSRTSACWRGYIGRWRIVKGYLCLVGLKGTLRDGSLASIDTLVQAAGRDQRLVRFQTLGMVTTEQLPAFWFTGLLRCPLGSPAGEVGYGWGPYTRSELHILVEEGAVVGQRVWPVPVALLRHEHDEEDFDDDA